VSGRLVLGGAPLGQPGDVGPRLRAAMASADVLAVEDTRRLHRLANDLEVTLSGRVVTFHESVERSRLPGLVEALVGGATVLLLTDAGMPSVSDPGYTLVRAAIEAGIEITSVPGPSAVTTALAVSGLPVDRFCFEGFLPRRSGERRSRFSSLAAEPRTMVFFESPHRLAASLEEAASVFGPSREAVVCRELTKTHEEIRRGPLSELAAWAAEGVRGEITLVVAGAPVEPVALSPSELAELVAAEEAAGADRKEAIRTVMSRTGLPRRDVYDAVVSHKP
jgi:16S rRNA (cytidine1402-2'-O)-methyltransferase